MASFAAPLTVLASAVGENTQLRQRGGTPTRAEENYAELRKQHQTVIINQLKEWVNKTQQPGNKQHEVFEPSFDWKPAWRQTGNAEQGNLLHRHNISTRKFIPSIMVTVVQQDYLQT